MPSLEQILVILLVVLVVLKFVGTIAYPWPLVLLPLWIIIGLRVLVELRRRR